MLVLSRRVGEKIVIDDCIQLTVVGVDGKRVRLGVTAPPWVRVDRLEVHEQRTPADDEAPPPLTPWPAEGDYEAPPAHHGP